jgi:TonB family protein
MRSLFLLILPLALSGCYTTSVAPDNAESANKHLAEIEKKPRAQRGVTDDTQQRLAQLFADRAEYLTALSRDDSQSRLPRVRSMVPPEYPPAVYLANVQATVNVAFAVDEEGHVLDPRIYESPDSRFNEAAIAAVKKWSFFSGSVSGSPAKFVIVVPIQFDGIKK